MKSQAVGHLLELAAAVLDPAEAGVADDLSPWRRVERLHPELAAEIDRALLLETPEAAPALLDLAERCIAGAAGWWPEPAARVVRSRLAARGAPPREG